MAVIKVACPQCGQRVSGDETFLGKKVPCPLCKTEIRFPKEGEEVPPLPERPVPQEESDSKTGAAKASTKGATPSGSEAAKESRGAVPERKPAEKKEPAAPRRAAPVLAPAASGAATPAAAPSPAKKSVPSSSAAVWSLVFGIATFALCPIGLLLALPAIFFGHTGRGKIQRSLGKLGGQGMANAGLALGYSYLVILALLILAGPWKAVGSFAAQRYNEEAATAIVSALGNYAEDNGGAFPASLEDLVPDYIDEGKIGAYQWIDPSSVPFLKRSSYLYYPGHKSSEDPKTILLSAPEPDGAYRRLVAYLDGTVEILGEEDFIRRTAP